MLKQPQISVVYINFAIRNKNHLFIIIHFQKPRWEIYIYFTCWPYTALYISERALPNCWLGGGRWSRYTCRVQLSTSRGYIPYWEIGILGWDWASSSVIGTLLYLMGVERHSKYRYVWCDIYRVAHDIYSIERLEFLDEVELLHQLLQHYCISWAWKDTANIGMMWHL